MAKAKWVLPTLILILRPNDRKLPWELHQAIAYLDKRGRLHEVAAGYLTDLASIPHCLPLAIDRPKARRSAVLHDWHYSEAPPGITRKIADGLFYESMRTGGVSRVFATAYWLAVRIGAGRTWKKYRKNPTRKWKETQQDVQPLTRQQEYDTVQIRTP